MSAKPTTRRPAKKAAKKPKRPVKRGYMGSTETVPLAIAAREGFDYQRALGNIPEDADFKEWRHAEVRACVGRDGLTDCLHEHFQPLLAHFKSHAGKDGESFTASMKTGPAKVDPTDTHEARRQLAHVILETLAAHTRLADISAVDLAAETQDTAEYQILRARRDAIKAHKDGAIREGYLVYITRQKTRRPDLTLGPDLKACLADRCTVEQLTQIRDTLVNRIAVREGRPESLHGRNRKRRSPAAKAARSPHELAPRFDLPDDLDPF